MSALIRNELLKLRTTWGPLMLLSIELVLVVIGVSGLAWRGLDPSDPTLVERLLGHAGLAALVTLILGIGAFGTEYRYKTITDTFLATPARNRVLVAKVVAYGAVGVAFGVASAATALVATAAWAAAGGVSLDLMQDATWLTLGGTIVENGLFAIIGVALGTLMPNLATAIAVALLWIATVEGLVAQLIGDLGKWLPMASGRALSNSPAPDLLPQLEGGLVLAAYAVPLVIAAAVITARRDVA
jgi:ABC-2 type transport system permease protein